MSENPKEELQEEPQIRHKNIADNAHAALREKIHTAIAVYLQQAEVIRTIGEYTKDFSQLVDIILEGHVRMPWEVDTVEYWNALRKRADAITNNYDPSS